MYGKERSGTVPGAVATPAPLTRSLPLPVPYRASTEAVKRITRHRILICNPLKIRQETKNEDRGSKIASLHKAILYPLSSILVLGALGVLAVCHFPPPILNRIPAEKFKR